MGKECKWTRLSVASAENLAPEEGAEACTSGKEASSTSATLVGNSPSTRSWMVYQRERSTSEEPRARALELFLDQIAVKPLTLVLY